MSEFDKNNNEFDINSGSSDSDTAGENIEHIEAEYIDNTEDYSSPAKAEPYTPVSSFTYQSGPNGYVNEFKSQPPVYTPPKSYSQQFNHQPQKNEGKQKARFSFTTLIVCMLVTALISTVISSVITSAGNSGSSGSSSGITNLLGSGTVGSTDITITDDSTNFVEAVAAKVRPSVVGIVTKYTYTSNNFFGSSSDDLESEGTGVIYSSDGYIITNKHVVDYAIKYGGTVEVYMPDDLSTAIQAEVVGYDAAYDLAVLKIDRTGLNAISIGASESLAVGQRVVAVGNPGGLSFIGSVSVGYISGLNRNITIDSFEMSLIQTDAAINPGNSGGALVDSEGNLIGITNSKIVSEEFEGMGFAIPIDSVVEICTDIITNRDEPKPYIGVEIDTSYTASYLEARGFPAGIVVASVVEDGPADKAGLQKYDLITAADGTEITTYDKLVSVIRKHKVGDQLTLTVYRNGQYLDITITTTASNG